jgi:hypothetical protein
MSPASPARRFGQFACRITIPNDLDAPLDEADLSECEGGA